MNPTILPNTHTILVSFPDWVYAVMTLGIFSFIFYLGSLHSNIRKVIKEFPKICRALDLISVKLKEEGFFGDSIYASAASPIKLTQKGEELLKEIEDIDLHDPNNKKTSNLGKTAA